MLINVASFAISIAKLKLSISFANTPAASNAASVYKSVFCFSVTAVWYAVVMFPKLYVTSFGKIVNVVLLEITIDESPG